MKKGKLIGLISVMFVVVVAILAGILLLGSTHSTSKQATSAPSQVQSSKRNASSSNSPSSSPDTSSVSQASTQSKNSPVQSSSHSPSTNSAQKSDHANLSSRDQQVTISASEIQATRGILKNAGIDDSKFTDKQIEDLMNQSIQTGKPIPDLARQQ